jgi:heat shock protein HtpX
MATLYTHQSENVRKTWFLMAGFLVVLIGVGWALSYVYGNPIILYVFAGFSIIMNMVAYWQSDKIALASARARPAAAPEYAELHRIVENLAITAGLPKPRVYIIDDPAPNAFATGRDPKNGAIAVTTGLLAIMDRNELEGVIAHELAHIGNRDILVATVVVVLVGLLAMVSDFFLRSMFFGGGRRDREQNQLVMILSIVAIILAPIVAILIQMAVSRKREFLADASGALLTRYPEGLASALQKIENYQGSLRHVSSATAHMYISNPFGSKKQFISKLFATHPPIAERVKKLLNS